MIFDTDVLIWFFRGKPKAAKVIEETSVRRVSLVSYMELLQGARTKQELILIRRFLKDFGFQTLPVTENISTRASIYMEENCLQNDISVVDALIAATAVEEGDALCTGNVKHFRIIQDLEIHHFRI